MASKFDTEPDTPDTSGEIESLVSKQLQHKIALLESKIKELETKISSVLTDPAFRISTDANDLSWMGNERSLGRIAGTIPNPSSGLTERIDVDNA